MSLKTVYGVIWTDKMLGHLTLNQDTAEEAISTAKGMNERGADKIYNLRAVEVTPENKIITLWSPEKCH